MLKRIQITSDKFHQQDYIIFSVQFLKLILFRLISYAAMNGLFCFYVHYIGLLEINLLM